MDNKATPKIYVCTFEGCKSSFPRPSKLANHILQHEGKKPFQCNMDDCNKGYTTKAHLKRHQSIQHEQTSTKTVCTEDGCRKMFSTASNMLRHFKRAHNPDRVHKYICKECNQSFPKKKLLHQHSYLHTGEFYYKCDICSQGFHLLSDVNKHKNSHASYACNECMESFKTWSDMRKHKMSHRPLFKCSVCQYKSYRKILLKTHEATHTAPAQRVWFSCTYENCSRKYLYKKNLSHHIKMYHEKCKMKKIKCPYKGCTATLSKMGCLKDHIQKIHKKSQPTIRRPRQARKDRGKPRANIFVQLIGAPLAEIQTTKQLPKVPVY